MRHVRWLIWLSIWASLSGCHSGPKVNYCISGETEYGCADGPIPSNQAEGMICTDTRNQQSLLRACKLGLDVPESLVLCVATDGGKAMACSDTSMLPAFGETNFVCLSQSDFDRLMIYCKRKANGNPS